MNSKPVLLACLGGILLAAGLWHYPRLLGFVSGQTAPSATVPASWQCNPQRYLPPYGTIPGPRLLGPGETPVILIATPTATASPCSQGRLIGRGSGWQIVAGYAGVDIFAADAPLYTLPAGASAYEQVPSESGNGLSWTPLQEGPGYWAYFQYGGFVFLPGGPPYPQTLTIATMPGTWVMIGNPCWGPGIVTGADAVYTYDRISGFTATTTLGPSVGALAYSASGAPITISPEPPGTCAQYG